MLDDDIRRSLEGFTTKRASLPPGLIYGHSTIPTSANVDSPVDERRMSFDILRASINASTSPTTVHRVDKHMKPLSRSQSVIDRDGALSPRGWFQRRGSSPLSASHGPSAIPRGDLEEPPIEITMSSSKGTPRSSVPAKGSGTLAHQGGRPSPRRSLSASILSLGKIVANMSTRPGSRGRDKPSPSRIVDSPSFKIEHIGVPTSVGTLNQANQSPSLSMSVSRPSSPLATHAPLLPAECEPFKSPSSSAIEHKILSPVRPTLKRQSKSDDVQLPRVSAYDDGALLSPLRALGTSKSSANSPMQSPQLTSVEEGGEAEDWLASLRGRPTVRRLSAADLFGLPGAPSCQSLEEAASTISSSVMQSQDIPPRTSPNRELGPLDFSKKAIPAAAPLEIPAATSTLDGGNMPLSRATHRSSLLSASRPNTPAGPLGSQPFPMTLSPTSPSSATRFLPHVHRKTQSSPAMALAAELTAISAIGPDGGESNVLNAGHARFAAVLTTAAAKAAAQKNPSSPINFGIKDKDEMRRIMRLGGIESFLEDDESTSGGATSPEAGDSGISVSRLPKLSYDTSASSETDVSLSFIDMGRMRESASSAPPATTSSRIKSLLGGPVPKEPVFAKSGSTSPTRLPSVIGKSRCIEDSPDIMGERDRFENAWMKMKRRAANVSVDSQTSALSEATVNDETQPDDPFQPRVAVW